MMKNEFEALIGKEVSVEDYAIIEHVYTWHPVISETEGKKEIAELYAKYGMSIIRGMKEAADFNMKLDSEEKYLAARIKKIQERRERVKNGDFELERAVQDIAEAYEMPQDCLEKRMKQLNSKYISSTIVAAKQIVYEFLNK